jgi:hypothetical protein
MVQLIFYGEPRPYRTILSDVRVIIVIMRVLIVELLCHAVMGWIPSLGCLLPSMCERIWLHLVLSGIKWPRYPRTLALESLTQY